MRIAVTGGIACGKSLAAKYLNEFGVETIDADDVVHELLPDPVERKRLAAEVFHDPVKRKALEARLHPLVRARIDAFLSLSRLGGDSPPTPSSTSVIPPLRLAIIPLLFETHWDVDYDIICAVISPRETQVERMMTTRGYTREEAEARLNAQLSVAEKAEKSHYVINNNGTTEELRAKVLAFTEWLRERSRERK